MTSKWLWLALLAGPHVAHGQAVTADGGAYRMQVQSRLVDTTLLVRDAAGKPITDLTGADFHIVEDGADQTLRYFATKRDLPLSIGLVVDVSASQEKFVKEHEREIQAFLTEVMAPSDRAFALCFGNHLRLTSDWTASPADILEGVRRFNKGERTFPELGPKEDRDLGTALFDAIFFPLAERMSDEHQRRRVLVVFSDGEENSSEHDLLDAISKAQETDTLVYSIRTTEHRNDHLDARDRYGMRVLDHLSESTGGRTFDASTQDAKAIFASIAEDLRSLYELGYYSSHGVRGHGFRRVEITVDRAGATVQARSGYLAGGTRTGRSPSAP